MTDVRERNTVWFCSWGAVLPSSPGQGLVTARRVAGLFAPEMFWRLKLGWDLPEEQSSGDGLALGGAVGAKSVVLFPQAGLLQVLSPTCHYPLSPRQDLAHPQCSPRLLPAPLSQPSWRGDASWDGVDGGTWSAPCHPHHKPWHGSRSPACSPTCF